MELKWKTCLRAGVTIVLLFLVIHYWTTFAGIAGVALGAATPLFWGCAIAYVVNIPMDFFKSEEQKQDCSEIVPSNLYAACFF